MGVPIDEYKVMGRLDNHPIVFVPLWESAPASDGDKWTFDLCNNLLYYLGELIDLIMACQLNESDEAIFKHS